MIPSPRLLQRSLNPHWLLPSLFLLSHLLRQEALDATKGMINAAAIAKMKPGVVVLNFARDLLVNEKDMISALEAGKVKKYVSDFPNPTSSGAKRCCKLRDHICNILMKNCHSAYIAADSHITCRVVYAVSDITIFKIVFELIDCHHGAVIFGFLCRSRKQHYTLESLRELYENEIAFV